MNQPYITQAEYEEYWNMTISDNEINNFKKNLVLAKEKIDSVTHNRIVALGFDKLTAFQKEKIKLAMFYQVQYVEENGAEPSDVNSYSVLDISVSVDKSTQTKAQKLHTSSFSLEQLQKTGLCTNNFRWH